MEDDEKPPSDYLPEAQSPLTPSVLPRTYRWNRRQRRWQSVNGAVYRNDLIIAVGLFELTNALDFPANVWNEIPIPNFAMILMGIGGSIAILWTVFGVWDLARSRRNIGVLRRERRDLKARRRKLASENNVQMKRLIDAWLDVNFRELGWEYVDRAIMDALLGFSGILVGTGAIMAMRGDIPAVFLASNLLSGYIGNSFLAAYALLNVTWSAYMWRRAAKHHKAVSGGKGGCSSDDLRKAMVSHVRNHQRYAVLQAVTTLISGAGSLVSATLWPGYVVITPCVFTSLAANIFWRWRINYNRPTFEQWSVDLLGKDLGAYVQELSKLFVNSRGATKNDLLPALLKPVDGSKDLTIARMQQYDLIDAFADRFLKLRHISPVSLKNVPATTVIDLQILNDCNIDMIVRAASDAIEAEGERHLRDQWHFLLELYACWLCADHV